MYFTIYKTTNLINGKIYVGAHKTDRLDDDYLGSGTYLNNAILKYGKENFSKDIIAICDTEEEMYALEESLVCSAFLTFFSTYNLRGGGIGGGDFSKATEVKLKKLREDPEFRKKCRGISINALIKVKQLVSLGLITPSRFKGKRHREESKTKISSSVSKLSKGNNNSQYGTMWITDGIRNLKIKKENLIPEGWRKGRRIK